MAQKIILFLSIMRPNAREELYVGENDTIVIGTQTNEAPVKYLLDVHPNIEEVICIVTQEAQETAWAHFVKEVQSVRPNLKFTSISYDENENFEDGPLKKILENVTAKDEIFLETSGGLRNDVMRLILISRVLSYTGVIIKEAVYSDFFAEPKRIRDISSFINMFDLVEGVQELTSLGSVQRLRKYYGLHPSDARIDRLLHAMQKLFHAITLCRTTQIDVSMTEFNDALREAEQCDDLLLKQLLPVFRKKFGESGKLTTPALIKWCLDSGMIQQAVTVYIEKIPDYIVKQRRILRFDEDKITYVGHDTHQDRTAAIFTNVVLKVAKYTSYYVSDEMVYVNTIENLSALKGRLKYKGIEIAEDKSIEQIQAIMRDYVYLKMLRNMINHASESNIDARKEEENYFIKEDGFSYKRERYYYKELDYISVEEIEHIVRTALKHLM